MKKVLCGLFGSIVLFSSCQKSISDFDPSTPHGDTTATTTIPPTATGNFSATIDGKAITFTLNTATFVRSSLTKEKRLDITGTSTDNTKRLTITLGEETDQGNALTVKKYTLNPFPDDDPATPGIDESLYTQGFTTYGTQSNNNWVYDVYSEDGSFTVTSCDATTTLISGTFQTTLTDLNDSTHVVKITAGKLTNVKYTILN